jgi:hypothetical protein
VSRRGDAKTSSAQESWRKGLQVISLTEQAEQISTSTAAPRLEEKERGKRKRVHIVTYKESVEDGELDES